MTNTRLLSVYQVCTSLGLQQQYLIVNLSHQYLVDFIIKGIGQLSSVDMCRWRVDGAMFSWTTIVSTRPPQETSQETIHILVPTQRSLTLLAFQKTPKICIPVWTIFFLSLNSSQNEHSIFKCVLDSLGRLAYWSDVLFVYEYIMFYGSY